MNKYNKQKPNKSGYSDNKTDFETLSRYHLPKDFKECSTCLNFGIESTCISCYKDKKDVYAVPTKFKTETFIIKEEERTVRNTSYIKHDDEKDLSF